MQTAKALLHLDDPGLSPSTRRRLGHFQAEVDAAGDYAAQVAEAKILFPRRNRSNNPVFREVRRQLRIMSPGAQRCAYCEDSVGDEVEHIKPKDLYPSVVFVWDNYVLACGPCNTGKSNKFAVIDGHGDFINVTRRRGEPVVPPIRGEPALINPRFEDPLEFLDLEISETFAFLPRDGISSEKEKCADFTIRILKLNRDVLLEARNSAFGSYRARLQEYRAKRQNASDEELDILQQGIQAMPHPSVWAEMKRQHELVDELRELFGEVPEALDW